METSVEFESDRPKFISYYEHEAEIARSEVHSKRWMIAAIIAFAALLITNTGWLIHDSLYQDVTMTETPQEGDGPNILGVGSGSVTYETDGQNNEGSR